MRLIDADATRQRVADTYFDTLIPCVNCALDDSPTVDAVPIHELRVLRDQLCEADRITMNGLGQLNALIAKYESSVL